MTCMKAISNFKFRAMQSSGKNLVSTLDFKVCGTTSVLLAALQRETAFVTFWAQMFETNNVVS